MTDEKKLIEEANKVLTPIMADSYEEVAEELEEKAKKAFENDPLDGLGWHHTYQAMLLRTSAKNIRKALGKENEQG